jgi:tetratricopeptide (TPR) repeat protein
VERLGSSAQLRTTRSNLIEQWVETGDWELAVPAADEFLAESEHVADAYNAITVAFVRAMLRLGLGDLDGAVADQAFALERARLAKDPQELYYALAVAVHVHADTGRLGEARERFDELLALDPAALRHAGLAVGDVAWAATLIDRVEPARRALAVSDWPAFRAGLAFLDGDAAGAAAICDEHGAARSAALARLRGGLDDGARAFFARIGATRYAEAYVVPST